MNIITSFLFSYHTKSNEKAQVKMEQKYVMIRIIILQIESMLY